MASLEQRRPYPLGLLLRHWQMHPVLQGVRNVRATLLHQLAMMSRCSQRLKKQKKTLSANPSNPPQRPTPRQVLKTQSTGQKPTSSSASGAAQETAGNKAARKRPAEDVVPDEGALMPVTPGVPRPPSKKVKGSNANVNKPQALRRTGSFFHQNWIL